MRGLLLCGNILPVKDFNIYNRKTGELEFDGSKILAIICDKAWFRIKNQDLYMDDFKNANNRSINYYLNAVNMFNYSYFADAVVLATETPSTPVTALQFEKSSVEIEEEGTAKVALNVTPYQATTQITYSSSDSDVCTVAADSNNPRKVVITGKTLGQGETSATATVTATAGNITSTITVTLKPASAE